MDQSVGLNLTSLDQHAMKRYNKFVMLCYLYHAQNNHRHLSRVEIAQLAKVVKATVTSCVNELILDGLVEEVTAVPAAKSANGGGNPRHPLKLTEKGIAQFKHMLLTQHSALKRQLEDLDKLVNVQE